ncbi:2Fe-2S iron-sulfur cluster-binding protein [Marinomonas sp. 2405UD68-3]|uniref:2Fe-2S iron-sulfur cluster-binding protein n=1 Tax=Marinomonas sp. 2405UD68-3 TaxID=3391835 RepID=UPI0039C96F58
MMINTPIQISFGNHLVYCEKGDNLLSALLEQKVDVPYGCRAGICRSCEVVNEVTQDTILCCQTKVDAPLVLNAYVPSAIVSVKVIEIECISPYCYQIALFGPLDHVFGLALDVHVPDGKKIRTHVESNASDVLYIAINPFQSQHHADFIASVKEGGKIKINTVKSANTRAVSRFNSLSLNPRLPTCLILVNQAQAALDAWTEYLESESIRSTTYFIANGSLSDTTDAIKAWLTEQSHSVVGFSRSQWVVQGSQLSHDEWQELGQSLQVASSQVTMKKIYLFS